MKLGFFTMPIHPASRDYAQTLKEDREAFILADRLGFSEAYVGEHIADNTENITSALSFLASLVSDTRNVKLGTGTLNLPNSHPGQLAAHVAMIDQMLEGRFIMGIGPGGLRSDMQVFGNLGADRLAMFVECIDQMLAIWERDPPYNVSGRFWNISTDKTLLPEVGMGVFVRPYQQPHPPIVVTAATPFSKGLTATAERGWSPVSANFLQPVWVKTHWPMHAQGCANAGRRADPGDWRVCKSIFVADDGAVARRYARSQDGPYGFYFNNLMAKANVAGRIGQFKTTRDMPDGAVTLEFVLDTLVICGTVDEVVEQLLQFREVIGDFGTLLYCGHDWADAALARRSMELMATEVIPRVNRAIAA